MQITHDSYHSPADPYSVLCVVRRPSDMFFQEHSSPIHRATSVIHSWPAADLRHRNAAASPNSAAHGLAPPLPDADSVAALSLIRHQTSPCLYSSAEPLPFDRRRRLQLTEDDAAAFVVDAQHRRNGDDIHRFRRGKLRKQNTEQLVFNSRLGRHESSRSGTSAMMELTTDGGGSLSSQDTRQEAPCDGSSSWKTSRRGAEAGGHGDDDEASTPTNGRPCKRANTCSLISVDGSRHDGAEPASSGRSGDGGNDAISQSDEDMSSSSSRRRRSSWSFRVVATLRANSNPSALASDVIAALDFDDTGNFFATGGISRKIRVCCFGKLTEGEVGGGGGVESLHDEAAIATICTPAKLSSVRWRPLHGGIVGCGDYDGVVTEWDVEQGVCVSERDEHGGRRIWSVDYSSSLPHLCASASADSTVKLWSLTSDRSVGVIRPPGDSAAAQVCCAQFSHPSAMLAIACADSNIFVYDLRRTERCLMTLRGHERAASYVRFLGGEELVSASIDSTLRHWAVTEGGGGGGDGVVGVYRGHRNVKNFVGLSVDGGEGLIACGSETNEVYVYERRGWEGEVWKGRVGGGRTEAEEGGDVFVGAVCWRPGGGGAGRTLVAANSKGTVELISAARSGGRAAS